MIKLIFDDCMEYMATLPDNAYDLAICDPPYGINWTKSIDYYSEERIEKQQGRGYKYHTPKDWDKEPPSKEYFKELSRVSKNQIIFGANYFLDRLPNPNSRCFIYWHKKNDNFTAITDEMAWTSFQSKPFLINLHNNTEKGFINTGHIHPTQKPIKLYEMIMRKFAKTGDTILDTHLGSGSSAIAAHNLGFDFTGIEIDEEYFNAASQRLKQVQSQTKLLL